jgi:SET domain-containing protein
MSFLIALQISKHRLLSSLPFFDLCRMVIEGKINFRIRKGISSIHGSGAFAEVRIPAGRKIGSLGGEVITVREARKKVAGKGAVAMVELWNGMAIDASVQSNELRYVNHSCAPNTYMRNINFHVEFYAMRPIRKGEELTCNYGPTHHEGSRPCTCGAPGCKGFL